MSTRQLVELMQHEADHATWWWVKYLGAVVVVASIAASAVWPWGVAA